MRIYDKFVRTTITLLCALLPLGSSLAQDNRELRDTAFETGKACSEQCRKKLSIQSTVDDKFDRDKYEDCINVCVRERKGAPGKGNKK